MIQDERAAGAAHVLGPGEGQPVWFLTNLMTVKATADQTNGAFGLVESIVAPGSSPPLHVHNREDESFYVIEGELTIVCGGETYRAPAGSFAFLPRGVPHTFRVTSDTPARMLTLITPGGGEAFFVAGGRPADTRTLPPAAPPDLARLRTVAERFGHEFVGPPLTPLAR